MNNISEQLRDLAQDFFDGNLGADEYLEKVKALNPNPVTMADISWSHEEHNMAVAKVLKQDPLTSLVSDIEPGDEVFMVGCNASGYILGIALHGGEAQTFEPDQLSPTGRNVAITDAEEPDELPEPNKVKPGEAYLIEIDGERVNAIKNEDSGGDWTIQYGRYSAAEYEDSYDVKLLARLTPDRPIN